MKKTFKVLMCATLYVMLLTYASCKKTSENAYIPECKNVQGSSQINRTENCKKCCKDNGWDNGVYWEIAHGGNDAGCECFND
jgi:hypothetical protein